MSQSRKYRGYASQRIVADYLRHLGYEYAESTGAGRSGSDVTGVPFDIEVKARRGFNPRVALHQLAERASDRLGFAVLRMNGQGKESIGEWVAVLRFEDLMRLIKENEWLKKDTSQPVTSSNSSPGDLTKSSSPKMPE